METNKNILPPKSARKFLCWYCDKELLEEIEGDLNEEFSTIAKEKGRLRANQFYVSEVVRFLRMYKPKKKKVSFKQLRYG